MTDTDVLHRSKQAQFGEDLSLKILHRPTLIAADWSAIRYVPTNGTCGTCSLPISALSLADNEPIAYEIPTIRGWYHSILCIECRLFGPSPHSCRWCGREIIGPANQRCCDDSCTRQSNETPFGNGKRLLNYLLIKFPNLRKALFRKAPEKRLDPTCRRCGGLKPPGTRADAAFCSASCKKQFQRESTTVKKNSKSPK